MNTGMVKDVYSRTSDVGLVFIICFDPKMQYKQIQKVKVY